MLRGNAFWASALAVFVCLFASRAMTQTCARSDFEAVVDDAAAELRRLNAQNKPAFQDLLRKLKVKRGWDQDVFLREAAPFVQGETIDRFDTRAQELLLEISNLGEEGSSTQHPDCALLEKVRERMIQLVASQSEKWSYMFAKLQDEIEK
jgi:hypothetical protein